MNITNYPDSIVDGYKKRCWSQTTIPLQLISFQGHSLKSDGSIEKRVNRFNEYYIVEKWYAINLKTQETGNYVVPVVLGHRYDGEVFLTEETSYLDRKPGEYPDNTFEVNLLQDSYEEFLENRRNLLQPNFHLSAVNARHKLRLAKLKQLIDSENDTKMKVGYMLHFIQKETPTLLGKRKYEAWRNSNPLLFKKLKYNVYQTNDFVLSECPAK